MSRPRFPSAGPIHTELRGFEGAARPEAAGGTIPLRGVRGPFAFNIDQTRDSFGGRMKRRLPDEQR